MLAAGPLAGLRARGAARAAAPDRKDAVMRAFASGDVDVLVATTVIEVGVDVANATMMVVLDADRFGVSQLHQLRGRVGRGGRPGCACWSPAPRTDSPGARAARRGRCHLRRLRALPGRPRAAPRGRRARRLPVRSPLQPAAAVGAAPRGRHRQCPRGGRAGWSPTTATWAGSPSWPPQVQPAVRGRAGRLPGEGMTRHHRRRRTGGRRLRDAARRRHPPDLRPGPRGAVLRRRRGRGARWPACASSTCTPAAGRSGWRRGPAGPAVVTLVEQDRRAALGDPRQRPPPGASPASRSWSPPAARALGQPPARAVRRGVPRPALRPARRRRRRPLLRAARPRLARARRAGGRRARRAGAARPPGRRASSADRTRKLRRDRCFGTVTRTDPDGRWSETPCAEPPVPGRSTR